MPSTIDFSGQFGGRDAHHAVRPHFKALKEAAKQVPLEGFPFPELAFILRVDGDVNSYGLSGAGDLEIDREGEYIAVDIGITKADRSRLSDAIKDAILGGVEQIRRHKKSDAWDTDYATVERCLRELCLRYDQELTSRS